MHQKKTKSYWRSLLAGLVILWLTGCVLAKNQQAIEMERLLTASGFQMRPADTPDKLAQLQQLPQRKLVSEHQNGKVVYIYADASYCQCVYTGSEEAYRRYQKLARERQVAEEDRTAEKRDKPAQIDSGDFRFEESW